ncbi:MAG: hypothetical protein ABR607_08415 [Pyrinomonadaceae bacterium]
MAGGANPENWSMFGVVRAMVFCLIFVPLAAAAQTASSTPPPLPPDQSDQERDRDPIENADEFKSKLTFGIYFVRGAQAYDLNLRHQFGPVTTWIAGYHDSNGNQLIRVGGQYDYHKRWFHFVPTGEIETTKGASLSLYSELGRDTVAIVGYSRTNLKTFFDLFWDPGDAMQLGVAHKISSYDRIQAYTIFDVRLHTSQENTHVLYRHKLNRNNGITFDCVFKSGRVDSGKFIHTAGIGAYYDRPKWFWKLYFDPHVNFTDHTMVRTGLGFKF